MAFQERDGARSDPHPPLLASLRRGDNRLGTRVGRASDPDGRPLTVQVCVLPSERRELPLSHAGPKGERYQRLVSRAREGRQEPRSLPRRQGPHLDVPALGSLPDAGAGVRRYQPVVDRLVQRGGKDTLHHADGVRVHAVVELPCLESPDVGGRHVPQPEAPEERREVVPHGPLVPAVSARRYLVLRGVGQSPLEILGDGEPLRIGEEGSPGMVGEGGELLVVGLLRRPAVEADLPPAGRGIQGGARAVQAPRPRNKHSTQANFAARAVSSPTKLSDDRIDPDVPDPFCVGAYALLHIHPEPQYVDSGPLGKEISRVAFRNPGGILYAGCWKETSEKTPSPKVGE